MTAFSHTHQPFQTCLQKAWSSPAQPVVDQSLMKQSPPVVESQKFHSQVFCPVYFLLCFAAFSCPFHSLPALPAQSLFPQPSSSNTRPTVCFHNPPHPIPGPQSVSTTLLIQYQAHSLFPQPSSSNIRPTVCFHNPPHPIPGPQSNCFHNPPHPIPGPQSNCFHNPPHPIPGPQSNCFHNPPHPIPGPQSNCFHNPPHPIPGPQSVSTTLLVQYQAHSLIVSTTLLIQYQAQSLIVSTTLLIQYQSLGSVCDSLCSGWTAMSKSHQYCAHAQVLAGITPVSAPVVFVQAPTFVNLLKVDTGVTRDYLPAVIDDRVGRRKKAMGGQPSSSSVFVLSQLMGVKLNSSPVYTVDCFYNAIRALDLWRISSDTPLSISVVFVLRAV